MPNFYTPWSIDKVCESTRPSSREYRTEVDQSELQRRRRLEELAELAEERRLERELREVWDERKGV